MTGEATALLLAAAFASSVTVALLLLLRSALRRCFGAPVAYGAWLMVPLGVIVIVLPAASESAGLTLIGGRLFDLSRAWATALWTSAPELPGVIWIWPAGAFLAAVLLGLRQVRFTRSLGAMVIRDGIAYAERTTLSPVVIGVLRPSIVVPGDFDSRYTAEERALILAHERTHIRRGDLIANALCSLISCLLWFNPLIHLAASRFRFDQELACDARTLLGRSRARKAYASAILKTVSLDTRAPLGSPWQAASPLLQRLQHLRQPAVPPRRRILGSVLVGVLLVTATCGAWALRPLELYQSGTSNTGAHLEPMVPIPGAACPLAAKTISVNASSVQRRP
jgi:bla regulator protein blaR1